MEKNDPIVRVLLWLIGFYKRFVSPFFPQACRFYPSCSEYGMQAIGKYGILKGGYLTFVRILRCNPLSKGGFDPLK